jgi:hypothetical protein
MPRFFDLSFSCLAGLALVACGADTDDGVTGSWAGEEAHLSVHGLLNGEKIDISIDGEGAADGSLIWCERGYLAPTVDGSADLSQAVQNETTISGYATVGGEERFFELEFFGRGLHENEPGTEFTIVPRVDDVEPEGDEIWLEWEWTTLDGEDLLEAAAQKGTFVLGQFTGKPEKGSLVIPEGDGLVGGYAEARWSVNDKLSISFSAPCTVNDVEEF